MSLKFCYTKGFYIKVFLKEEVLRNSLEKEIEISAWKVFASSHLLTNPGEDDKADEEPLYVGEKKAKHKVREQKAWIVQGGQGKTNNKR